MNRKPGMKICVCQIVVCNFNLAIKLPCSWKEIRKITRYGPKRPAAYIGWGDFWFGPFWRPRRLLWPQKQPQRTDLTSDLKSVTSITYISMCILLYGMVPFDSLWGHCSLQTASEVRSDLSFEIRDPKYLHIHMHIAYMFWACFEALLVASEATTASKRPWRSDLISDLEFVAQIACVTMFVWTV